MADNFDPEQLRLLEEQLKQLKDVIGNTYDGMDDVNKMLREESRMRDKVIQTNIRSLKVEDQRIAAHNMAIKQYEQQMAQLGLVKNELGQFQRVTVQLTNQQQKRLAQEEAINTRQKARDEMSAKMHSMLADKTGSLIKGLSAFGTGLNKTLFDSTKGQSKYGETMNSFGNGIIDVTKNLGPLGQAAGFAAGALFKLVGAAFKQQEQLNKSYEKLSEFGAVDVSGIQGMFKNLQNAGMTVAELDKFGDILKSVGPNLATLGTTAADGAKSFAETMLAVKNSGAERQLRMLGFTSETMVKTFADYQGMMGRLGFIQGKSTQEVAKQSTEYAKTLDELAKLTGQSRDELQKRMDADANDIKFRLKLQDVQRTQGADAAMRLQKASALIGEFGEDTASGFREMVANNGKVVGEASARLMLSTGNAAKQIAEDVNAGRISGIEAARLLAEAKAKQVERFREVGKLDAQIMQELGLTVKDMDAINKYRGKTQSEVEKMDRERELQMQGSLDNERAADVQRQLTERNMEQAKDRIVNLVGKQVVGAFEVLMKMVNNVAKQLSHFLKWLGGPDFTDMFDSAEDIKSSLDKTTSALDQTNKQIENINSARDRYLQKDKELLEKNKQIEELQIQYSNETNAEKKKELNEQLKQARMDRATLDAEARMARQDFNRQKTLLPRLEQQRTELEKQQTSQRLKLEQTTGITGEQKESPEVKKIRDEQQKLLQERNKISEVINDSQKLIYNEVMKDLKFKEEDLKDEKNKKQFDDAYAAAKKSYMDRRTEIDKNLEKSQKDLADLNRKEVDSARARAGTSTGVLGAPGTGSKSSMGSYLQKVAQIESGGRAGAKAGTSTASGLFQFTEGTWKQMTKQMGKNYSLQDRFDPAKSAEVAKFFTEQQSGQLSKALGREPNDAELYMAHFLGAGGAIKFLTALSKNPGAPSTEGADSQQIQANRPIFFEEAGKGRLRSLQEVYALMARKVDKAGEIIAEGKGGADLAKIQTAQTGGLMSGPDSGYPVLLHGDEMVLPLRGVGNPAGMLDSVKKTTLENSNIMEMFSKLFGNNKTDIMQSPSLVDNRKVEIPVPNIRNLVENAETKTNNITETNESKNIITNGAVDQNVLNQLISIHRDLIDVITNKMDQLDSRLAKSNDIQSDILTYSAA